MFLVVPAILRDLNVLADSHGHNAERIDICALSGLNKTSCLLEYMCKHCYLSFYLPRSSDAL